MLPAAIAVTTLNEVVNGADGVISLREAITTANGNADADDISFAAGLSGGTINLTGGELVISGTTTITGFVSGTMPPLTLLTIDANDLSRIFRINNLVSGASTAVELFGLTLTDGNVGSGGGAILHESGALEIRNCTIT